jgi:hypothetical protein
MSARDAFGVSVRVIGLLIVLAGLLYLVDALLLIIDPFYFIKYRPNIPPAPMAHYLRTGIVSLVAGLFLLRGARLIEQFAYGKNSN